MPAAETLLAIENALAAGDGAAYRRHLREDAVVIVPGEVLDRDSTAASMDASPGWDEFALEDETVVPLGEDSALLSYRFSGRRGDFDYAAILSSAYVMTGEGEWKLAFHQQTPIERD